MIWALLMAISVPSLALALPEENSCPRTEDMKSCCCSVLDGGAISITCHPRGINKLRNALVNLRGKKNIHFTIHSTLPMEEKIPSDLFKGLDVIKLTTVNVLRIGDEGRSSLEGLEDTLESLFIYGNIQEKTLEFLNITALNVLHKLRIEIFEVPTLGNDVFAKSPVSLKKLEIRGHGITEIGDTVFEKFVNLEDLCVLGPISDFRRSMLPSPALYLERLDLSKNRISVLPEDMFVAMPSLRTVHLEYNNIARLPEATWSPAWSQLDDLNIWGNYLDCDSHIDWMFRIRRPKKLEGKCYTPKKYRQRHLISLIEEKSI